MLGRISLLISLTLIFPHALRANDGKDLAKFINIERNTQGGVVRVTLKRNNVDYSGMDLVEKFLKEIISAQNKISLLEQNLDTQDWPEEHRKKAKEAIDLLKQNDLKPILEHPALKKALHHIFQEADNEGFNFRILAVPDDSKFFEDHEILLNVLRDASGLVRLAMGNSYGAAVALYLIQTSFDMILERRIYFQNYFLYYLEKYGPEKLGLRVLEAKKIKSSIFESRIRWWEFWERSEAQVNWEKYGHNKHLDTLIAAMKQKKAEVLELNTWGNQLGFAFHDGELGNSKRIVNLVTPRSVVSQKLSHTFDFANPKKIASLRLLYFLLQIGIRLAPTPAISTVFDFFMDSLYIPQRQMEGALVGYFRDENSFDQGNKIAFQSINPFIIAEVLSK
ncbi:MAG: hypothetical protein A4S09_15745 [Proteobacteria bacterium SG_bin7]|nr:MAG: hypothetical protein A4S09_15745 [Proteobacteria bacterium SG_bin7]